MSIKASAQNYKQALAVVSEKLTFRERFRRHATVTSLASASLAGSIKTRMPYSVEAHPKRATVCIMRRDSRVEEPSLARTPFCRENTFLAVGLMLVCERRENMTCFLWFRVLHGLFLFIGPQLRPDQTTFFSPFSPTFIPFTFTMRQMTYRVLTNHILFFQ